MNPKKNIKKMLISGLLIIFISLIFFDISSANSHIREDSDMSINIPNIPLKIPLTLIESKCLLIQDATPWDSDSNKNALQSLGIQYDTISSSSISTTDLSNYKFIMYASDQNTEYYQNIAANINKIEDYIMHGGFLIAHCCDQGWAGGEWSGLKILPGTDIVGHINEYLQSLHILNSNSPIVSKVWDTTLYNWYYSSHGYFANLPAGANVVITTDSNQPTYIDYKFGLGRVIATMQTIEWGYGHRGLTQLLINEINYAASGVEPKIYKLKVSGGLSKYEGNYKDIVFRRGQDQPTFEVTATLPADNKLLIDISRGGNKVATLAPTGNGVDVKCTSVWDWTSNKWSNIPNDIQVGTYKAKARIISKGGKEVATEEKEFYVIFDYEIEDPFVESTNNYAVDQVTRRADFKYPLNQYESNKFSYAISVVEGEKKLPEASIKLKDDAHKYPHDCTDPEDCKGAPHCRHYAWAMIENCRAVGIPARFLYALGDWMDGKGRDWGGEHYRYFSHAIVEVKDRAGNWIHYDPTGWGDDNEFGCDEYAKVGAEFRSQGDGYWVSAPTTITTSGDNEQPVDVYDRYTFCSDATGITFLNPPYDYGQLMHFKVTIKNKGAIAIPIGVPIYVRAFDVPNMLISVPHLIEDVQIAGNLDAGDSVEKQFDWILPNYEALDSFYEITGDRYIKAMVYYKADNNDAVITNERSEKIPGLCISPIQTIDIDGSRQSLNNSTFTYLDQNPQRSLKKDIYILDNNASIETYSEADEGENYLKSIISIGNPGLVEHNYTFLTQLAGFGDAVYVPSVGNITANTSGLNISTNYFITYNSSTITDQNVSIHEFSDNMTIRSICLVKYEGISGALVNVTYNKKLGRESSHDLMIYFSNRKGDGSSFSNIYTNLANEIVDNGDSLVDMDIPTSTEGRIGDPLPISIRLFNNGVKDESIATALNVTKVIENIPPTTFLLYNNLSSYTAKPGIEKIATFMVPTNDSTRSGYWNINVTNDKGAKAKSTLLAEEAFDLNISQNLTVSQYDISNLDASIKNIWSVPVHGVSVKLVIGDYFSTADSTEVSLGDLLPNQEIALQWQLNATSLGNLPIEVQVTSADGGYDAISSSIIVISQPILWMPSVSESNLGGENKLPLDVKIYNIGDQDSHNVCVDLTLPEGVNATKTTWSIDDLPGHSNATLNTNITFNMQEDFIINVHASDEAENNVYSLIYMDLPYTLCYPEFTDTVNSNSWRSWLMLRNPSNSTANISLEIRSRAGDVLYTGTSIIPANGVSAIRPRNLIGSDSSGSVVIRSYVPITGTCQITRNNNEMSIEYNAIDHGSTTLYYPDFTDTTDPNSWRSWLFLQNPMSTPANLSLSIRSRAGDILYSGNLTIPANAVSAIRPRNLAGSDLAGSAIITSNQSIMGTCQITRNSNNTCVSYNAADSGSATLYYPDFTDSTDPSSWRSWLIIQNSWSSTANLTLEIRSRAGDILYKGNGTVPAYGVSAIMPRNLAGSDVAGSAVITSDLPIIGTCKITRNNNEIYMSYNAADSGSATLYYPDFTDTADPNSWRSWLVMQNPTNSTANTTLEVRSRAGDLLYTGNQTIPANGVNAIRPRTLVGSDCTGTVAVTSDQPIIGICQINRNNNLTCMSYSAFEELHPI